MDFIGIVLIVLAIFVVISVITLKSQGNDEKEAEQQRVSKIPESELTSELKEILQRRQDFLNNWRNIRKGLTDYTGTHVIKNINCDSCGREADMILYRKMKKIIDGEPIEKYYYYCSLEECQELQDIDSSGVNIVFIGGLWK